MDCNVGLLQSKVIAVIVFVCVSFVLCVCIHSGMHDGGTGNRDHVIDR